jgi:hemolysin III
MPAMVLFSKAPSGMLRCLSFSGQSNSSFLKEKEGRSNATRAACGDVYRKATPPGLPACDPCGIIDVMLAHMPLMLFATLGRLTPAQITPAFGINEPFSSLSHFVGATAFAVLGVLLLRRSGPSRGRSAVLLIYVASQVLLFTTSGLFHLFPRGSTAQAVFGRLDYASIFVLIAGSCTPTYAILFRGWFRWIGLAFIWTLAIAGVVAKTVFYNDIGHGVSIALYLFMGWSGAIAGFIAWRRYGNRFVAPLFAGAIASTLGTLFEANATTYLFWTGVIQSHELWHLAVLLGAAFHWTFIYQFASGILPPLIDRTPAPTRRDGDLKRCSVDDAG